MTLSYPLRLMCLSLACLFAANFAASILVRAFASRAIRRAGRMEARRAARFLLALRLLPAAFALFCVAGLCVPSYLWLEPESATEQAGVLCLIAAALGAAMWIGSVARAARAAVRSLHFVRRCLRIGVPGAQQRLSPLPIVEIPGTGRVVALAGIFRPRLVMSSQVAAALDRDQLDAVVRHEAAHHVSRDNFKRLLIALAPGWFLGSHERAWKRFSEWAADDRAAAGDPQRAADLAMALVRVARLEPGHFPPLLATPLLADNDAELAVRVERLLENRSAGPAPSPRGSPWSLAGWLAAIVALAFLSPAALAWVHGILERLMD